MQWGAWRKLTNERLKSSRRSANGFTIRNFMPLTIQMYRTHFVTVHTGIPTREMYPAKCSIRLFRSGNVLNFSSSSPFDQSIRPFDLFCGQSRVYSIVNSSGLRDRLICKGVGRRVDQFELRIRKRDKHVIHHLYSLWSRDIVYLVTNDLLQNLQHISSKRVLGKIKCCPILHHQVLRIQHWYWLPV